MTGYKSIRRKENIVVITEKYRYIICFAVLVILCSLFPYTGDDWAWGSSIGIERLRTWFDNYSGRYLGNLIVLVLTRSRFLNMFVKAFCLTGIVYFLERLTHKRSSFYIGCIMLILIPKNVFRQAVVWTSGFSNYVTSVFLTLIYIVYIYPIFEKKQIKQKPIHGVFLLILGIANTLIVEHLTVYNVLLAVFVLGYTVLRYRRVYIQHISYFFGTIFGTYYMFSNSVYHSISANEDGYRSVASGGLVRQVLGSYFETIYKELFMNNLWLNILLLAVCFWVYYNISREVLRTKEKTVMRICLFIFSVYIGYSFLSAVYLGDTTRQFSVMCFEGIATAVCCLAIIVFVVLAGLYYHNLVKVLFVMGSIICVTAPLFVVNPIGSRCFFVTYVLFILLICEVYNLCPEQERISEVANYINKVGIFLCIGGIAFYLFIFSAIYSTDKTRLEYIREQAAQGETEIEILHLPYETYLWTATPTQGGIWEERYKLFYDLPDNIHLQDVWKYSND